MPCPALWVDAAALAEGQGALRVLYRLGGGLQHAALAGKPLRLQPVKQQGSSSGGSARQGAGSARQGSGEAPACRAFISARRHTQLYRLVVGLFPKLEQLHAELHSGVVALRRPLDGWVQPGSVTATPLQQVRPAHCTALSPAVAGCCRCSALQLPGHGWPATASGGCRSAQSLPHRLPVLAGRAA